MTTQIEQLTKENEHFLYLERLNIEFKTFEPRLRDLEIREAAVATLHDELK